MANDKTMKSKIISDIKAKSKIDKDLNRKLKSSLRASSNALEANENPTVEWARAIGTKGSEEAVWFEKTTDGGYIIVGENSEGSVLVKLDSSCNVEWSREYNVLNSSIIKATTSYVQPTQDGGYILTGTVTDKDYDRGPFVIKIDANGNYEWIRHFITEEAGDMERGISCIQTKDGGYMILGAGDTKEIVDNEYTHWATSFHLLKLDASGNKIWEKNTYKQLENDIYAVSNIIQNNDGDYVFTGLDKGEEVSKVPLVTANKYGNVLSYDTYSSTDHDNYPSNIYQTSDGGYVMSGFSVYSSGNDPWVAKIDNHGKVDWQQIFPVPNTIDSLNCVKETSDGGYITTGSIGPDNKSSSYDICTIKLNYAGQIEWAEYYGGTARDLGECVIETPDHGYLFLTTTDSYGHGGSDIFLIKLK
ncbi:hypothetical protein [Sporohalobacter salinus]|uniref:hypothetical protein n=1 Tax=Sporohalobacter salinus TaxID=1494606 RepID=UPI00196095BF|nr:hypothetical protein [Sporohalobacter salinus]MBM7623702.1 hypothetical protein [Sporohalobacter salinus]